MILAGGEGRRIGGRKPLVLLSGKPLALHVAARLRTQVEHLALNAAPAPGLDDLGLLLVPDELPGRGPLAGMLTAMRWADDMGAARVLTAAVDTPFLPATLAKTLAAAPGSRYAMTPAGPHATTGIWPVDLADSLQDALNGGIRRVLDWTAQIGAQPVAFPDERPFFNVNTEEDLRRAEAMLAA